MAEMPRQCKGKDKELLPRVSIRYDVLQAQSEMGEVIQMIDSDIGLGTRPHMQIMLYFTDQR